MKAIAKEMTDEELFEKIRKDERGIVAKAKEGLKQYKGMSRVEKARLMKTLDSIKTAEFVRWN